MLRSSAFGLRLRLNRPVPGLPVEPEGLRPADVAIALGELPARVARAREDPLPPRAWHSGRAGPDGKSTWAIWKVANDELYRLIYPDGTEFLIDAGGSRVWGTWSPPWTLEDAAVYLLGPVMGFVLGLRGLTCLHSSALAVAGRALAVVGPSGAGKSTLSAALARRGLPVLTDDVVALDSPTAAGEFLVPPGYPRLRLWPESVRALHGEADVLPPLTPNWGKCYADLAGPGYSFQARALPLGAVYLLGERRAGGPSIEALSARDALVALTANRYFPLPGPAALSAAFGLLSQVVVRVPVRRLNPDDDPATLPRLGEILLADFEAARSS